MVSTSDTDQEGSDRVAIILYNDKERDVAEGVVHRMVKRAVEMEGTVTGEHGIGKIESMFRTS